ncbi:hypothetical protein OV320_7832 [Actinobacteria bacterium OV320]|nr:hypothetical protein OV320_7832 [Actinobacteria bacterium OV320]
MERTPANERQHLFLELEDEVNKDYASIVINAWAMVENAKDRKVSGPKLKSLNAECAGMEKAALLVIRNHEYLEPGLTPEKRLRVDKERYLRAREKDKADEQL